MCPVNSASNRVGRSKDRSRKVSRHLADLGTVHEDKCLRRRGGDRPPALTRHGVRPVEHLHHGDQFTTLHGKVDAPAFHSLVESAGSMHPAVNQPADRQCVVPDNLRLESAGITLPPITIFWIQGHVLLVVRRTHPIGVTHHDLLVESFECPPIGNQIMGEIIEEMRMSGLTSLETKVINGFHDAPPKMMMPEPVNNDPRKEVSCTVVHISDPLSYSASFHRCPGSGGLVDGPVVSSLPVTRENFEEVQWGDAAFLGLSLIHI